MGVNVADTYIFYKPLEEWPKIDGKVVTKDDLADRMSGELGVQVPGQAYLFSQPIEMRFNEILEGTRADIAMKVFGEDYGEIERIAGEVREILKRFPAPQMWNSTPSARLRCWKSPQIARQWPSQCSCGRDKSGRRKHDGWR